MSWRTPTLAVTAFLVLTCAGCERGTKPQQERHSRLHGAAAGCNVVLITLDTTRADRLGCYGYERAATPALDAIARRGVRFDRAYVHVPITAPSHACLLTGTRPPENGVRVNGRQSLVPTLTTLAEAHRQHGYRTAAFVASIVLDQRYGLDRGFDLYDDEIESLPNQPEGERPAKAVCDRALQWLDTNATGDVPFMCWVHFFDPHTPYTAPQEFEERMGDPYDAEVAYMDVHIGRLIDWLESRSLSEKMLLVVVGDHGESLGEHDFPWHALLLYQSIVRVPLIFALPGVLPEDAAVQDVTRLSDVMPTILDLLGWPVPAEVSGESFASAFAGETLPAHSVYGETDYPLDSFGWSPLLSLIEGNWKYIRAPVPELYDLSADPGELKNLAAAEPGRVGRMEAALADVEAKMVRREAAEVDLAAAELATLRGLGYVGDGGKGDADDADLKNPIDMVDVYVGYRRAEEHLTHREAPEAIEILEPLAERSPESFVILAQLAKAYAGAGALECAQGLLHEALGLQPESPGPLLLLARVYEARGAAARAVETCRKVLEIEPDHEEARNLLPALEQARERQEKRLAELREQFRAEPTSVDTCLSLAAALLGAEQATDALGVLRAGLARHPDDARLASELAWQLATLPDDQLRNASEAVRLARLACRGEDEQQPDSLDTLGAALAETGQFEEAAEVARRASELARQAGQRAQSLAIERRLRLYQAGRPYRSPR
jgi:arylsulfatase A-like enzyme/Flp pilus assembly protein TadD